MPLLKMILGFAPWLSFLIIAHDSMFRLKLGLIVALSLTIIMGVMRLHRGVILWAGLVFFAYAMVAVVILDNMWTVKHMGVLANSALALATWYTVAVKRPFTMDYARDHTPPALWQSPMFLRSNMLITTVWGFCFSISAMLAWHRMARHDLPDWEYETISYAFMLIGILFSTWYPAHLKRQREALSAGIE